MFVKCQLETGRPNGWHDTFTLNSGLDRSDIVMAAMRH